MVIIKYIITVLAIDINQNIYYECIPFFCRKLVIDFILFLNVMFSLFHYKYNFTLNLAHFTKCCV